MNELKGSTKNNIQKQERVIPKFKEEIFGN
jgi:hypothetical protein